MNKKQRILIESLTNANARITRLENENSLLHVRINTLEQFLNKYGERIARLEVIDKVCTYENEAEHNKVYPNKIDSLLAKHMTKVFNDWSEYDEWLKINVMNISVRNITEVNKRLLITYEEKYFDC